MGRMSEPRAGADTTSRSLASDRAQWMDLIRGAAILLVLLLHATTIPWLSGDARPPLPLVAVNEALSPYRMPLLFLLSGLLLERSLRKPLGTYYGNKVRTLVWPYLLWSVVGMLSEAVLTGARVSFTDPELWAPNGWLWFIAYLIAFYAAAPALAALRGPLFSLVPAGMLLLALLLPPGLSSDLAYYGAFFFGGLLCARYAGTLRRHENVGILIVCLAGAGTLSATLAARTYGATELLPDGFTAHRIDLLPAVIAGIAAAVLLARRLVRPGAKRSAAPWLRYIGENSVVFYVTHVPVIALVIAWIKVGNVLDPNLVIPACFLASVGVGYLACWLRRYAAVRALFVFPKIPRRHRASATIQA